MSDDPKPNLGGRPSKFTPELAAEINGRLASGRTLRSVCRDDDMPERRTVYDWLIANMGEQKDEHGAVIVEGFHTTYTRARECGLAEMADETIEIADDGSNDYLEVESAKGKVKIVFDKEAVARSKLRVEARNQYLENMEPRKYGRRAPIEIQNLDKKGEPTDPAGAAAGIPAAVVAAMEAVAQQKKRDEADNAE